MCVKSQIYIWEVKISIHKCSSLGAILIQWQQSFNATL